MVIGIFCLVDLSFRACEESHLERFLENECHYSSSTPAPPAYRRQAFLPALKKGIHPIGFTILRHQLLATSTYQSLDLNICPHNLFRHGAGNRGTAFNQ